MKIPTSSEDVEEEWVQDLLQNYCDAKHERRLKISIKEFGVTKGTKPGESFNGQLIFLSVKTKVLRCYVENGAVTHENFKEEKEKEEEMSFHLVLKFLSQDVINRELIKVANYHTKELRIYSTVIDILNKYLDDKSLRQYSIQIPEFYYGNFSDKNYVLVIENMKPLGYDINDKMCGLSVEQARLAVEHLARIHAASYSYEKQRDLLGKFPCLGNDQEYSIMAKYLASASLESVLRFLKARHEYHYLYEKLIFKKKQLMKRYVEVWSRTDLYPLMCLCHGDYWNNNLLFLQNDSCGTAGKVSIIDWQMAQWSNPLIDLHYMLGSSTTLELRKTHLEELKALYHSTFVAITSKLETSVPEWSYEAFKAEYDRTAVVGLLIGLSLCQGTLSKAGESINQPYNAFGHNRAAIIIKTFFTKIMMSVIRSQPMRFVIKTSIKKMFEPICREMIKGKNAVLNKRILDLLAEADENGSI